MRGRRSRYSSRKGPEIAKQRRGQGKAFEPFRVECPGPKRLAQSTFEKWHPSRFYVEGTANATELIQELKDESHLPIIPVKATASKESRAESVSGIAEARRVVLPSVMALTQVAKEATTFSFTFGAGVPDDLEIDGKRVCAADGDGLVISAGNVWRRHRRAA